MSAAEVAMVGAAATTAAPAPQPAPAATGSDGDDDGQEPRPPPPQAPPCEQCGAAPSKYRCPACSKRSCSLGCVSAHKAGSGCSGKRDRAAFVAIKEFDDKALLSDFRLLEEIGRADDVARRCRPPGAKPQLPPHLASLVYQGSWRSVKLLIMPPGMAKRKANTTRYDSRARTMFWRVEWRFPGSGIECVDERVDEHKVVGEVLAAHLRHPAPHYIPLRPYARAGLESLRVFMRKEKTPANQPAYFPIDISKPLASQLSSRTIIEYPVMIVALPHEAENYPPPAMLLPQPPRPQQQPGQQPAAGAGSGATAGGVAEAGTGGDAVAAASNVEAGQQGAAQQGPQQQGQGHGQGQGQGQVGTAAGPLPPNGAVGAGPGPGLSYGGGPPPGWQPRGPPPPPPPRRQQPAPSAAQLPPSASGAPQPAHPQAATPAAAGTGSWVGSAGVGVGAAVGSVSDDPASKRVRLTDSAQDGGVGGGGGSAAAVAAGAGPGPAAQGVAAPPAAMGQQSAEEQQAPGQQQDENEIDLAEGDDEAVVVPEGLHFYYGDDEEDDQEGGGDGQLAAGGGAGAQDGVGDDNEIEIALEDEEEGF